MTIVDPAVKRAIDEAIAQLEQANEEFKAALDGVQAEERILVEEIHSFKPETVRAYFFTLCSHPTHLLE